MNLLSKILIQPNVITPEGISFFRNYIENSEKEDLSVFDADKSNKCGETQWSVDKQVRDTQHVPVDAVLPQVTDLMNNIVHQVINPFYDIKVRDGECPQFLVYNKGGHYTPHIDGEGIWVTPEQTKIWRKTTDRDLSLVLFLNDDFEGGEFYFPDLKIKITPEPGLLVCFPSNHYYVHGVLPVKKGIRYSMVSWLTIQGWQTKEEQDKELLNKYKEQIENNVS